VNVGEKFLKKLRRGHELTPVVWYVGENPYKSMALSLMKGKTEK
jgi:hypothetical protein